jgi:hypothetical protein
MTAAVDWLDAYRVGEIDAILKMCAEDVVVECRCGSMKTIAEQERLRAYWERQIKDYPALDLDDIQSSDDEATISYLSRDGVVVATLEFNANGRITLLRCGLRNNLCGA